MIDVLNFSLFSLTGLLLGGILVILIHRYPLDLPLFAPLRCARTNEPISFSDWLPIYGYIAQRGVCRHCQKRLPLRFAVIEIITALCFGLTYGTYGLELLTFVLCFFEALLIVIAAIDYRHRVIFPVMIYVGVVVALVWSIFHSSPLSDHIPGGDLPGTIFGGLIGGFVFLLIYGMGIAMFRMRALGFGDVYLAVLIGAICGLRLSLPTLFLGTLLGSIYAILVLLRRSRGIRDFVPFGTWMAAAAVLVFIFGEHIWHDGPFSVLAGLIDLLFQILWANIQLWLGWH